MFGTGLQEEAADSVGGYSEGDSRCDFHRVDADHLTILQEKNNTLKSTRSSQWLEMWQNIKKTPLKALWSDSSNPEIIHKKYKLLYHR